MQPVVLEPLADGFVVGLEEAVSHDDGHEEDAGPHGNVLPQRSVRVRGDPVHLHIHQRVMRDVDGIGDVAEPSADGRAPGIDRHRSGARQDDDREQHQDADRLVQAVRDALLAADARHGQQHDDDQAAPPETTLQVDRGAAGIGLRPVRRQDPGNEQAAQERIEQPRESDVDLVRRERPAADHVEVRGFQQAEHVPAQGEVQREEGARAAQDGERGLGQVPEDERIQDVADILERQCPLRAVERVQFAPTADIQPLPARDHEESHQQAQGELPAFHFQGLRERGPGEEEQRRPDERARDHHRVQARETPLEESPGGHPVPPVVIGVAHDKAAQREEEIHRQVPVIHDLEGRAFGISLEDVEQDHHEGGHAAEPVQDLVAGFGCQIDVGLCHTLSNR